MFPLSFHIFRSIELDNCWDKVATGHHVWGHNVHRGFDGLLFQPPQQLRQLPPHDVDEVVTNAKDVPEYPGILWECHVQATHEEICRSLGKIIGQQSFNGTEYDLYSRDTVIETLSALVPIVETKPLSVINIFSPLSKNRETHTDKALLFPKPDEVLIQLLWCP